MDNGYMLYNSDWAQVMPDIFDDADDPVIVTDPPFNIGYSYDEYKDSVDEGEYYRNISELFQYGPVVMIHYPEQLHRISIETGTTPDRVLTWVYNSNTAKQHRDIAFYGISPDLSLVKRPYCNPNDKRIRKLMERTGGARSYDWQYTDQVKNKSSDKTDHPCQMPLDVMRWVIGVIPGRHEIVDPFMGSGTTGVAARMAGLGFYGCEISKHYFDIASERIRKASQSSVFMQPKPF